MKKANNYLNKYIDAELWDLIMQTYDTSDYESAWHSLIITCELFEKVAPMVGKTMGFVYNYDEAKNSFNFIKHIKELPNDATEIY